MHTSDIAVTRTFTYKEFREYCQFLSDSGSTSGPEESEEKVRFTALNTNRMKRLEKQAKLEEGLLNQLNKIDKPMQWMVLTETWCGDSAQTLPVIAKMADANPNIELMIALRDENPALMDAHLTNGKRSIPKLICIDPENGKILGTWGPRPQRIQEEFNNYKAENPDIFHDELVTQLHLWYGKNRGKAVMEDFEKILPKWLDH